MRYASDHYGSTHEYNRYNNRKTHHLGNRTRATFTVAPTIVPLHTNEVVATQCRGDPCGRLFAAWWVRIVQCVCNVGANLRVCPVCDDRRHRRGVAGNAPTLCCDYVILGRRHVLCNDVCIVGARRVCR